MNICIVLLSAIVLRFRSNARAAHQVRFERDREREREGKRERGVG